MIPQNYRYGDGERLKAVVAEVIATAAAHRAGFTTSVAPINPIAAAAAELARAGVPVTVPTIAQHLGRPNERFKNEVRREIDKLRANHQWHWPLESARKVAAP